MVMHARKRARPNDGYYDRHDSHEKDDRYGVRSYDRKQYDRRNRDEYDLNSDRQDSPRLSRKYNHGDRLHGDRDRNERYHRDVERYYDGRRADGHDRRSAVYRDYSNEQSTNSDTLVNATKGGRLSSSRERELNHRISGNAKDVNHPSEQNTNSIKSNAKEYRGEAQKLAIRVCGDWSEHISSSGKRYFYNCKTEVSQWVKPKEWLIDDPPHDSRHHPIASSINGDSEAERNGSRSRLSDKSRHASPARRKLEDEHRQRSNHNRNHYTTSLNANLELTSKHSNDSNSKDHNQRRRSVSMSPCSMDTSSPAASDKNENCVRAANNDESGDDMDISPDSSPSPEDSTKPVSTRPAARPDGIVNSNGTSQQSDSTSHSLPNTDQSVMWGQALQTLQTLQEVLTRRNVISQNAPLGESPQSLSSQSPRVSVHQSPAAAAASAATAARTHADQSRLSEPSTDNVDNAAVATKSPSGSEASVGHNSAVSSATADSTPAAASPFTVSLPPSLANHFDSSLIVHMKDWPGEELELKAHAASNEGLIICGHRCGQMSVDLKRDRSSVRIAEVQSTLIEHRILFLKNQISELETQDKTFSSSQT